MTVDSKKMRSSIKDLEADKTIIKKRGEAIKETSQKLVGDKGELDRVKKFVESVDLPEKEKADLVSAIEQQHNVLEDTFERDVEKPSEEIGKELDALSEETKEYADNARENKEKLEGVRMQGNMDDSAIKGAAKEQTKLETDYTTMAQDTEREAQENKKFIDEQKNKVRRV